MLGEHLKSEPVRSNRTHDPVQITSSSAAIGGSKLEYSNRVSREPFKLRFESYESDQRYKDIGSLRVSDRNRVLGCLGQPLAGLGVE